MSLAKRLAAIPAGSWCQLIYGGPAGCSWNPMLKTPHTCGRGK
jgi:hypothetical protein